MQCLIFLISTLRPKLSFPFIANMFIKESPKKGCGGSDFF